MCFPLNELATPLVSQVNPLTDAILRRPSAFNPNTDISPDGTVKYDKYKDFPIKVDVQAASSGDLQLVNQVQQQADVRKVFIFGDANALNRPLQVGGDILLFRNAIWQITEIQQWDSGRDYAECLVTRQVDQQQSAL